MHSTDQNPLQKTSSAQKNGEKNPLESPSKLGVSVIAKDGQSIVNNVEQAVTETSSLRVLDRDEKRVKKQKNLQNTLVGYLLGMNLEERDYRGNLVDFSSNYYVNEKDFNFGDYVLVFPNPDHPVYKNKLNYTFNFSETLQMLNKFFITTNTQDKSYANIFDRAFAIAFNQLKQSPIIGKKPDYIKR